MHPCRLEPDRASSRIEPVGYRIDLKCRRQRQGIRYVPTRPRTSPSEHTRKRILDTAERLFGESGVAAVSLRDINRAAGISQGVLHYHFGGRDALIEALLQRTLPGINAQRRQMLATVMASGRTPDERDFAEILCLPLARLAVGKQSDGHRFLRCLARLSQEHNPVWARMAREQMADMALDELLRARAPACEASRIEWAIEITMNAIHSTLNDIGRPVQTWQHALAAKPMTAEQQIAALTEFVCAGIRAVLAANTSGT